MTLSCSRHGYEEAMWTQDRVHFLRAIEHAFLDFGGVPEVLRPDYVARNIIRYEQLTDSTEETIHIDVSGNPTLLVPSEESFDIGILAVGKDRLQTHRQE